MSKIRVVHYVNQFFAGIGGEEKADVEPAVLKELPPVSVQLGKKLGEEFEIVATVVCGDSYFNENIDEATGLPTGTLRIPAFLMHNYRYVAIFVSTTEEPSV